MGKGVSNDSFFNADIVTVFNTNPVYLIIAEDLILP